MDHEEKEELKQNDLVTWFQIGLPIFLKKYGSYLLLAGSVALLGFSLWRRHENNLALEVEDAWNKLSLASDPAAQNPVPALQSVINEHDVKSVQALAWLRLGNLYLETVDRGNPPEGYRGIFEPDGKTGITKDDALTQAKNAFDSIVSNFADQSFANGAAHMGLAAVALDRGNFDDAKTQYTLLTAAPYTGTAFAKAAQEKLAHLDDYRTAPNLAAYVPSASTAPASLLPTDINSFSPGQPMPDAPFSFPTTPSQFVTTAPTAPATPTIPATLPTVPFTPAGPATTTPAK